MILEFYKNPVVKVDESVWKALGDNKIYQNSLMKNI